MHEALSCTYEHNKTKNQNKQAKVSESGFFLKRLK